MGPKSGEVSEILKRLNYQFLIVMGKTRDILRASKIVKKRKSMEHFGRKHTLAHEKRFIEKVEGTKSKLTLASKALPFDATERAWVFLTTVSG